jgi:2-iminobutanoate/2-iminopropanoate deaminase
MEFIRSSLAPPPGGHYSQAVVANGFVFVSGQLPLAAGQQAPTVPPGIAAQTRLAFGHLAAILEAAGSSLDRLVSVTVYLADIADWPLVNEIYAEILGGHRPARTIAVSPQLHHGCRIEVQATALAA